MLPFVLLSRSRTVRSTLPRSRFRDGGFVHPTQHVRASAVDVVVALRWVVIPAYFVLVLLLIGFFSDRLGVEIFPRSDAGEFRLRLRAPDGTHIDKTEQIALEVLDQIKQKVSPQNVELSLGYVGMIHSNFPVNAVYQFSRGAEEAILRVTLRPHSSISTERLKEELRRELPKQLPGVRFSFEPADIISKVMSIGSPTPIEIAARGGSVTENRAYLDKVQQKLAGLPEMREVQLYQSLDHPPVDVKLDRERAPAFAHVGRAFQAGRSRPISGNARQ